MPGGSFAISLANFSPGSHCQGLEGHVANTTPSPSYLLAHQCGLTIAIIRKRTVKLHGQHCEISVHREGKHVWNAVGDYLGKEIRAQAESEGAAVKRWRETASTMGDNGKGRPRMTGALTASAS